MPENERYTAFVDGRKVAHGDLRSVTKALMAETGDAGGSVVILSDASGRVVDIDPRASMTDRNAKAVEEDSPKAGRGRPKLGVVAREVTLLPRKSRGNVKNKTRTFRHPVHRDLPLSRTVVIVAA